MSLKRRVEPMERKLKPGELRAIIEGFSFDGPGVPGVLASDDPRLQEGVDEKGEAAVSRWWVVSFFEGTRDQQNARLKELRLDPDFQKPCRDGDVPICFQGGATCEDAYLRIAENEKDVLPRLSHLTGNE
jgi:hypothetical protein